MVKAEDYYKNRRTEEYVRLQHLKLDDKKNLEFANWENEKYLFGWFLFFFILYLITVIV